MNIYCYVPITWSAFFRYSFSTPGRQNEVSHTYIVFLLMKESKQKSACCKRPPKSERGKKIPGLSPFFIAGLRSFNLSIIQGAFFVFSLVMVLACVRTIENVSFSFLPFFSFQDRVNKLAPRPQAKEDLAGIYEQSMTVY